MRTLNIVSFQELRPQQPFRFIGSWKRNVKLKQFDGSNLWFLPPGKEPRQIESVTTRVIAL